MGRAWPIGTDGGGIVACLTAFLKMPLDFRKGQPAGQQA
jgi:hypothetical protein